MAKKAAATEKKVPAKKKVTAKKKAPAKKTGDVTENGNDAEPTPKKKAPARKTKAPERRELTWGVFSSSMKEEARFPYAERKQADEKVKQLKSKSKKMFWIQPIKEVVTDPPPDEGS